MDVSHCICQAQKAPGLKPSLGLKKSLATRNLLTTTTTTAPAPAAPKPEVKETVKEEKVTAAAAVVEKPDAYSGKKFPTILGAICPFMAHLHFS